MRKLSIIPVLLIALVGIVFASGVLFPNTVSLPRSPGGAGTMSGILSLFELDGTAPDTNMLSGVSASGYLQNTDCSSEPINKVWIGVDADGKGICGNTSGLVAIAYISEFSGNVQVWRDGTPGYVPAIVGQDLYEGDLIQSDSSGTGTIRFVADNSLIRFLTSTDLELRYGDLEGKTVAEVILNDGRLWGRILSSTGVNLGGGGTVTGVRGTSVDLQKTSTGLYILNIVSSANSNNNFYKQMIYDNGGGGINKNNSPITLFDEYDNYIPGGSSNKGSGAILIYMSGANSATYLTRNPALSYSSDPWIRNNAIADIAYMSDILSGATNPDIIEKLNTELDTTIIAGDIGITQALLIGGILSNIDIPFAASLLIQENTVPGDATLATITTKNKEKSPRFKCKRDKKTYFPNTNREIGVIDDDGCGGSYDTLAMTNFPSDLALSGKEPKWNFALNGSKFDDSIDDSNNDGFDDGIDNVIDDIGAIFSRIPPENQYLSYTGSFSQLSGKIIQIELQSPLPSTTGRKYYIFDGGISDLRVYKYGSNLYCTWRSYPSHCLPTDIYTSGYKIAITLPKLIIPTKMIFGAYYVSTGEYNWHIDNTIRNISIIQPKINL